MSNNNNNVSREFKDGDVVYVAIPSLTRYGLMPIKAFVVGYDETMKQYDVVILKENSESTVRMNCDEKLNAYCKLIEVHADQVFATERAAAKCLYELVREELSRMNNVGEHILDNLNKYIADETITD